MCFVRKKLRFIYFQLKFSKLKSGERSLIPCDCDRNILVKASICCIRSESDERSLTSRVGEYGLLYCAINARITSRLVYVW